jgi:GNAT superfamily N-acetyltransferase
MTDPVLFREVVFPLLKADPIRNVAILTSLERRIEVPDTADRYLVVLDSGTPVGAVISTRGSGIALGALREEFAEAVVPVLGELAPDVVRVEGEPEVATAFAKHWAGRYGTEFGQTVAKRLHRLERLVPHHSAGTPRLAIPADHALCVGWDMAFDVDVGEPAVDRTAATARSILARRRWLWEVGDRAVSMVGHFAPVAGVGRVGPVYTPPQYRGRGFASALTTHVSKLLVDHGFEACLYTDLSNPTSNKIYAAIGYRPVADLLRLERG